MILPCCRSNPSLNVGDDLTANVLPAVVQGRFDIRVDRVANLQRWLERKPTLEN